MAKAFFLFQPGPLFSAAILVIAIGLTGAGSFSVGQTRNPNPANAAADDIASFKSSPAYAELQLKRTELSSDLESLILEYTEEYPKVKEFRFVISLIDRDIARLGKSKPREPGRFSVALGKLMIRKIELETDLWNLQRNYKDEHPDVKRAKRKVEIYETAIAEILG